MNRRALGGLLAALALAGCSSSAINTTAPTASPTPSPTPVATQLTTPSPAASPVLLLEPDGVGYRTGASSIRHLPFATTTAAQITAAVSNLLGTGKTTALPECGQGPRTSYAVKGFTLLFEGATWTGWTDQGAAGRSLTTADGVGVGRTRAQLEASGTALTFSSGTLGAEFSSENSGLGGLLNGTTKAAKVTTVYAGETCFFR